MGGARSLVLLWGLLLAAVSAGAASAAPLVADLSSRQIRITTGFTGTNLLLFGATDGAGDVVVVVRGPKRDTVVRRKERIGGIWVNASTMRFSQVPAYYFVAASRPLNEITNARTLERLRIGVDRVEIPAQEDEAAPTDRIEIFRKGLIELKQSQGLFSDGSVHVAMIGDRLFRADLTFPANVPTGGYTAEVYLFREGRMVGSSKTALAVRRAGMEAAIFDFAHEQSAVYGIVAILVALLAGWLSGVVFRKV